MNELNKKAILIYAIGTFVPMVLWICSCERIISSEAISSCVYAHFITWTFTSWVFLAIERLRGKFSVRRLLNHVRTPVIAWLLLCFFIFFYQSATYEVIPSYTESESQVFTVMTSAFDKIAVTIYILPFLFMFGKESKTKTVVLQVITSACLILLLKSL